MLLVPLVAVKSDSSTGGRKIIVGCCQACRQYLEWEDAMVFYWWWGFFFFVCVSFLFLFFVSLELQVFLFNNNNSKRFKQNILLTWHKFLTLYFLMWTVKEIATTGYYSITIKLQENTTKTPWNVWFISMSSVMLVRKALKYLLSGRHDVMCLKPQLLLRRLRQENHLSSEVPVQSGQYNKISSQKE